MLIENKALKGEIVGFTLVTGLEVMGRCVEEKVTESGVACIRIAKPIGVQMQMVSAQQAGIGFVPVQVSTEDDGEFLFAYSALAVMPRKVRADLKASYVKMTSGLEVPKGW